MSWEYRERLARFYQYYNPSKVAVASDMLRDARGHEEELFDALSKMYGPEPPVDVGPLSPHVRLSRFYQAYNPARLADVPRLLHQYAGCEDQLFAALVHKYGPEPDSDPRVMGRSPANRRLLDDNARLRRTRQLAQLRGLASQAQSRLRRRCLSQWLRYLWSRRWGRAAVADPFASGVLGGGSREPARARSLPSWDGGGGTVVVHHHHHRSAPAQQWQQQQQLPVRGPPVGYSVQPLDRTLCGAAAAASCGEESAQSSELPPWEVYYRGGETSCPAPAVPQLHVRERRAASAPLDDYRCAPPAQWGPPAAWAAPPSAPPQPEPRRQRRSRSRGPRRLRPSERRALVDEVLWQLAVAGGL
eukprot:TRINITY_DN41010_c0_g1_i1.p2 TRINITY_DN41010_c0_g1~~TRINITY_DN41010_c0_g1_i1.p2  ORF type:complete len:400 (+),score=132.13 TRINITY_DN41010_c0_g1_i1:124-1200(+)